MRELKCGRFVLLFAVIVATACGGAGTADSKLVAQEAPQPEQPVDHSDPAATASLPAELLGRWKLVAIDGEAIAEVGTTPFVLFAEDGTVGGVGGINRFNTKVTVAEGKLSFSPAAMTKMAGPPEAMDLEDTFMNRLMSASSYAVDGDNLLMWAGDNEALKFARNTP